MVRQLNLCLENTIDYFICSFLMTKISNLIKLNGRRALITGATGNLGKVISDTLAELGADLILIDKDGSDFDSIKRSLEEKWFVNVEYQICNLEQESQRSELITFLNSHGKGLNILLNNAAFVGTAEMEGWAVPFERQTLDSWRRAIEVNLTSVFHLSQGLTPLLAASAGGTVINIASIYGSYGPDWSLYEGTGMGNPAGYGVSKGGLIQFTRWLATTVAPNVRVNAISPGGIFRNQPDEFVRRYQSKTPLARMATEDDFRGAVAYLASDMSGYVTGQNLVVDGGWGVW